MSSIVADNPSSVIPAKAGTQDDSYTNFPGSRTLRKSKHSLRFSKFRDDAPLLRGAPPCSP
jgi:hypothetical protein